MEKQPKKLRTDPILEALFEIRFETKTGSVSDLLPGLLFSKHQAAYSNIERLPTSFLPRELQQVDAQLRYQPRYRLKTDRYVISIGDYSVLFSCLRPYVGWLEFKPKIVEVISNLQSMDLISGVSRFSLKYINLLEAEDLSAQFALVKLRAEIGKLDLTKNALQMRSESPDGGFLNIVEFSTGMTVKTVDHQTLSGAILSIDTISQSADDFWAKHEAMLEDAHTVEKSFFFSMLSEIALEKYGAEY